MDLKLNISKKGLSTTEEVINEEYTLHYGHVFRGLSAYEQAQNGGYSKSEEEFEHDLATMLTPEDIVDNLTTNDSNKPLSAAQGYKLNYFKVGHVKYDSTRREIVGQETANGYLNLFTIDASPFIDAIEVNFSHAQSNIRGGNYKEEFAALAETFAENNGQDSKQPVAVIDEEKGCVIFATSVTYDFGRGVFRINANMDGVYTIDIKNDGTVTRAEFTKATGSDNNYTDEDKELVQLIPTLNNNVAKNTADIKTKQNILTLTMKPNGNIVIGNIAGQSKEFMPATPSGDPMHYAYEAVGAVWNASTGYWEMYDMKDITTEQMRRSYNFGHFNTHDVAPLGKYDSSSISNIRFNLPRTGASAAYFSSFSSFASANFDIEVINLMSTLSISEDKKQRSQIVNASYAFNYCEKLRRILSFIDFTPATNVEGMFRRCFKLEQINCFGLKQDVSFADSPLLSKESLLYMIRNCASNATFTITLHPDVYGWAVTDGDMDGALSDADMDKQTRITLASA